MKVLFGVDGSSSSSTAVQFAGRLLCAESDRPSLYYSPPCLDILFKSHPESVQKSKRLGELLCDAVFAEAKKQLPPLLCKDVQTIVGKSSAAQGILRAAEEFGTDLIVVGSHGTGRVKDLDVGRVARSVVHESNVPVLVVRSNSSAPGTRPLRVLLAIDESNASRETCAFIERFNWPQGTHARVIRVVESPVAGHIPGWLEEQLLQEEVGTSGPGYFGHQEEQCRNAREEVTRHTNKLPELFRQSQPIVLVGHACEEIVNAIVSDHFNLVIVGARGLSRVKRLLLGSTSEYLLRHAPCSVLIVPPCTKAKNHDAFSHDPALSSAGSSHS